MLSKVFTRKFETNPKTAAVSAVLVADAFIWYLYSGRLLIDVVGAGISGSVQGVNVLGTVFAALLGATLSSRLKGRIMFLRYWMLAGIFLSLIPIVVDITGAAASMVFFAAMGVYFGLGMPVCLAYFAASTETVNRSRIGGLVFFLTFLGVFIIGILQITNLAANALILAICKLAGFLLIFTLKPKETPILPQKAGASYRGILSNKVFLLYFTPWIMFLIINYISAGTVAQISPGMWQISATIENLLSGIFVLVFGFFADYMGRKRLVVAGFILLGVGYASLGLLQQTTFALIGWWFYTVVDGLAWGLFYTIFLMTIWGDLSQSANSEKYYTVGFIPFLLLPFMDNFGFYLAQANVISAGAIFSFASVFLFLAVLPLAYAPETLNLKDREFKTYKQKALRVKVKVDGETSSKPEAPD
jgi:MFS family permease